MFKTQDLKEFLHQSFSMFFFLLNSIVPGDLCTKFCSRYDVSLNTVDMFGAPALLYAAQQQDSQSLQYLLGNLDNF